MKMTTTSSGKPVLTSVFAYVPLCLGLAADPATSGSDASASQTPAKPAPAITVSTQGPAAVKLPYGVEDILKLSRAQIGEDIIVNYVQNSGTIYNLEARDIVYLRDQGVSEKVINTMLNQRNRVELAAAQSAAMQAAQVQTSQAMATSQVANDASTEQAGTYTDANATYVTAPLNPPASTAYVIPSPAVSSAYYGYYYPYYYGPSVSFAFGVGGYYGGNCYYGHGYYHGHGYYGGHGGSSGHGGGGHGGHR